MRGLLFWISGSAFAFFVTAGSFLLLANASSNPSEKSLSPVTPSAASGSSLDLSLREDQLSSLKRLADQNLTVTAENPGGKDLSGISLTLKVSSEDTSIPEVRYYRATRDRIKAGKSSNVDFDIDLSPLEQNHEPTSARMIIEVRATTPSGVSAVKTAILPAPVSQPSG